MHDEPWLNHGSPALFLPTLPWCIPSPMLPHREGLPTPQPRSRGRARTVPASFKERSARARVAALTCFSTCEVAAYHIGVERMESGPHRTITPGSEGDLCTLTWNSPWVGVENGNLTVTSAVPSAPTTSGV